MLTVDGPHMMLLCFCLLAKRMSPNNIWSSGIIKPSWSRECNKVEILLAPQLGLCGHILWDRSK